MKPAHTAIKNVATEVLNLSSAVCRAMLLWVPLCVLPLVLGACATGLLGGESFIEVEPAQLQARIAAKFPLKNCATSLACVAFTEPVVTLAEGTDRLGLMLRVTVSLPGRDLKLREWQGRVGLSGQIRYQAGRGEFYLDEPLIDQLDLPGFSADLQDAVRQKSPALLRPLFQTNPIYTLKTADTAQAGGANDALLKTALRDVRVVGGKLRITYVRP